MSESEKIRKIIKEANQVWIGEESKIEMALLPLLCGGHLLIEDSPGVGKTTLTKALATLLGINYSRISFTNDLLPADILGTHIFSKKSEEFLFQKGPIFSNLILIDELNRATPKTQSALLQVMEEKKISIENKTFELDETFSVMATQNPFGQIGTFPLPESQRDRFFMSISLGIPDRVNEERILLNHSTEKSLNSLKPILNKEEIEEVKKQVFLLEVSSPLVHYVLDFIEFLRMQEECKLPISPRCGKDLLLASKGRAFMEGRDYVIPEDVQAVLPFVVGHRLFYNQNIEKAQTYLKEMIHHVAIP